MVAAHGLAGLFLLDSVSAAPPPSRPTQIQGRQLDLSPPTRVIESSAKTPAVSAMGRQQSVESPQQDRFANLGLGSLQTHPSMEQRIREFHRDGLPVARLWENKSALLHLGLNQKGKPGLWIVQKTH
jgi:hypothetical protein